MQLLLLGAGTVLAVSFIVQLFRGRQYDSVVDNLDSSTYPLCSLYTAGFMWGTSRILAFKGRRASQLKTEAKLLHGYQYSDFYANVAWAQTITLVQLFLTVTLLAAAIMYESMVFILGAGIFLTVLMGTYCLEYMRNALATRTEECESELPEVVSTMAILVNSGMVLKEAWETISENGEGPFYELMCQARDNMQNGFSDADAVLLFGKSTNSAEIKKFTSALLQSMERGGGELSLFLAQQSSELWNTKRQKMLQSGEKAATKLLLPIVLIFVGIIIIVMTAAFAGSLF